MSELINSRIDRPNHHLKIVPISHEALFLEITGYGSQDNYLAQLKREMEVQEELLAFVEPNSPEYDEIKENFDEVLAKVFIYHNSVSTNENNTKKNNSEVRS